MVMENVILSNTEKHPIVQTAIAMNQEKKRVTIIYGLAKRRGDNIITTSRLTDAFYSVLKEYGLTLYEVPEDDPVSPQEESRSRLASQGVRAEFVGIAYNIRMTWDAEKYTKLVEGIVKSLE